MAMSLEQIKSQDMVGLLKRWYGMEFQKAGGGYVSLSPFRDEERPSFHVRRVDGRWLFKDFSSGHGGSLIDFVLIRENLHELSDVVGLLRSRLEGGQEPESEPLQRERAGAPAYDVKRIYGQLCENDVSRSAAYLKGRGIGEDLVEELVASRVLLHNRYQGRSYCCFAVQDAAGEVVALDNHGVGGAGKFVLGGKAGGFSLDWDALPEAETVFVTEGIVDYLSVKTLEGRDWLGVALMGNLPLFSPEVVRSARRIISALDSDDGGLCGFLDLLERFPDKQIQAYDLEGHKDPAALLETVRAGKRTGLSSERKLALYREFLRSANKSELARKWGVDRSYMYEIVRECEQMILKGFDERQPGRKPAGRPQGLPEAWDRIEQLEAEKRREAMDKETYYARSEFLGLRLKYAEEEASQGTPAHGREGKKRQIKKKRKKRR